jgi:uncharacterized protein (DUF1501 family)
MKLCRRDFMRGGVAVFSLGWVPACGWGSELMMRMAAAQGTVNPDRANDILVMIEMNGGNDGLNTVIPYTDPAYYSNRPTLGIAKDKALDIGGVGLHPSMTKLKSLFDAGEVAVVQGVGYPNANQSHFRSMDIWQTAVPDQEISTGWLGRYLDEITDDDNNALYGIAFTTDLPRELRGEHSQVPAIPSFDSYRYQTDPNYPGDRSAQINTFTQISSHVPVNLPYVGLVQTNIMDAYTTADRIQAAGAYKPTVTYPNSGISDALKLVAESITKQFGTHLFHVVIGGFDTHANQAGQQAKLLGDLSNALAAFFADLKNHSLADNVLAVTFSEFGRRVQENGSAGTDHGAASVLFAVGGKVKGGLYGTYPSLSALDNGNLRYTVDFRRIYASVLDRWLGGDSNAVLYNTFDPVTFL